MGSCSKYIRNSSHLGLGLTPVCILSFAVEMLARRALLNQAASVVCRRNFGLSAVAMQKKTASDPIQNMFVTKIREYDSKNKAAGGKMLESNPELAKIMNMEIEKLTKAFGGGDMNKFPEITFEDAAVEYENPGVFTQEYFDNMLNSLPAVPKDGKANIPSPFKKTIVELQELGH